MTKTIGVIAVILGLIVFNATVLAQCSEEKELTDVERFRKKLEELDAEYDRLPKPQASPNVKMILGSGNPGPRVFISPSFDPLIIQEIR